MIREKTKKEIIDFCKENNIECLNIRSFKQNGKSRIKVTIKCRECGSRSDILKENLISQKFPGLCTSCAHKKSQDYRRLEVESIVGKFESAGYKVLTPKNKIKPVGKSQTYNKSKVMIENKFGQTFVIDYNNFSNRLQYYKQLNSEDGYSAEGQRQKSRYEQMVANFLDEQNIPYKREFKFTDCKKKRLLPFDFCLWYNLPNRVLIEVDGELHYKQNSHLEEVQSNDEYKTRYCEYKNIPLLRIPYWEFNESEDYKKSIFSFIHRQQ